MDITDSFSPSKFLIKVNKRNRYHLNQDNQTDDDQIVSKRRTQEEQKNKVNNLAERLRTLLKLPKAHKWVIYEWFYSNLDQPLFCLNRQNDFQLCLNDTFPQLKTRNLRRIEWCQIRRLLGKPRRCSNAFLEEERETLKRKREKLREIYLSSSIENLENYSDLPEVISLPLIIGSRCTVLFKKTHEGLFNGTINAIDLQNGTYRVSFDKPGFGCENIYDFEVQSIESPESMPLLAFEAKKNRPVSVNNNANVKKLYNQNKLNEYLDDQQQQAQIKSEQSALINEQEENSPTDQSMLNEQNNTSMNSDESFVRFMNHCSLNSNNSNLNSSNNQTGQSNDDKIIGNYPLKFLALIINFYKLVNKKSGKLEQLKTMNTQAEFFESKSKFNLSDEFRNEYATIILELEKIKDNMNSNLEQIDKYVKELKLNTNRQVKNGQLTEDDFLKHNLKDKKLEANSKTLITNLIGLLLMLKNSTDLDSDELSSLQLKLKSIKQSLHHKNNQLFENNVEMHFNFPFPLQFNYLDNRTNSRLDGFCNDNL